MTETTTLSVSQETATAFKSLKREGETHDETLTRLIRGHVAGEPPAPPENRAESAPTSMPAAVAADYPDDPLTESHIDDIVTQTARLTTDMLTDRLTRGF